MPRRIAPMTDPSTPDEILLERLEHDIVTGMEASQARNDLIARMARQGVPKADIARRINRVRAARHVPTLTYSAVERAIGRTLEASEKPSRIA